MRANTAGGVSWAPVRWAITWARRLRNPQPAAGSLLQFGEGLHGGQGGSPAEEIVAVRPQLLLQNLGKNLLDLPHQAGAGLGAAMGGLARQGQAGFVHLSVGS